MSVSAQLRNDLLTSGLSEDPDMDVVVKKKEIYLHKYTFS